MAIGWPVSAFASKSAVWRLSRRPAVQIRRLQPVGQQDAEAHQGVAVAGVAGPAEPGLGAAQIRPSRRTAVRG
jgi:hypothetical protein